MMRYKGYAARVEYDEVDNVLHGRIDNIDDVISFEATSVEEIEKQFHVAVDDYITYCAERGREPEKPYSGKFVIRVEPDLHRRAAVAARAAGMSLNAWVAEAVETRLSKAISRSPAARAQAAHPIPDIGIGALMATVKAVAFSDDPFREAGLAARLFARSDQELETECAFRVPVGSLYPVHVTTTSPAYRVTRLRIGKHST